MSVLAIIAQEAAEHGQPSIFNLSLGVSAWTVVIFLVLLGVLSKYAFPAILGYASAREKRIQDILDAAARDRGEAERLLAEQRQVLAEGRQQAQQMLTDAKQAGERLRQEFLDRAREEQEQILVRARQEIERERERATDQLRRDAVDLALGAASKLVSQRLGAEQDRELVRDYLEQVGIGAGVGAA